MSETERTELEVAVEAAEKAAKEVNDKREGKGTRVDVRTSRGRSPIPVSYEMFDRSKPETCPESIEEFMLLTGIDAEPTIIGFLIDGFNGYNLSVASDPVAEFVDPLWGDELKKAFREIVRKMSANAGMSIEESVNIIKPGISAKFAADVAAEKAKAELEAAKASEPS